MAEPTLLEIDRKIRTLSALISKLNKQVEVPEFTDHSKISATLVACTHVAILLTRGTEDVDHKGIGPARKVVAVSGKLSSGLSLAVSVDAYEPVSRAVFTQNPNPKDQPEFRIDRILPSPRSLKDLTAPPYRVNEDPLYDYAAHLLAAFRDLKSTDDRALFTGFIVRSCLPKITHRLHADLYVFKRPLDEILSGWTPQNGEVLAAKQVRVLTARNFRLDLASILVTGEEHKYEWNINTASIWINAFCHMIRSAKRSASDCRDRNNKDDKNIDPNALIRLDISLNALYMLSHKIPIRELLSLPSIQLRLKLELKDNDSVVSDEDGPDMALEANEEVYSLALRYLHNAVAWQNAIHYVFASVQKPHSFGDITLDFVITPVVYPDTCAPDEPIVSSAIEYMLKTLRLDREAKEVQLMIQEIKNKVSPVRFRGTVHCEASLMGLVVACMDSKMLLPNNVTRKALRVIKEVVTKGGVSTIGVGKKCCWCCSLLAKQLQAAHPGVSFDIPASHGLIFPWALPTIGISAPVAESMEAALTDVWRREVVKFAGEFAKPAIASLQSAMSSPLGSISGDFNLEDTLERLDHILEGLEGLGMQGNW